MEAIKNRPLNEGEQVLKQAFLSGPTKLWEKPMSYSAYEQYVKEGLIAQTTISHYYRDKSVDGRGVKIMDVKNPGHVFVTLHQRYSYPVLHNHDYVEIVYVAAGSCVNMFEATSFSMNAGDVCILSPNSLHAISCTNDDSCILNMMINRRYFDKRFLNLLHGGKLLAEYLEDILFERDTSPYVLFASGEDPCLQGLAQAMVTESESRKYAYEYSLSLLIGQFLLQIVREYETAAIVPARCGKTQNDLIVGILSYLSVHYNHASLAEAAQYFGYSPAYLSRVIREQTGKTFNTIIAQKQMEQALLLMDGGNLNLTAIAQEIGCFDTSHFNKKFKAVYGISPKAYIDKLKQPSNSPLGTDASL